jgi:hypothetical protein
MGAVEKIARRLIGKQKREFAHLFTEFFGGIDAAQDAEFVELERVIST